MYLPRRPIQTAAVSVKNVYMTATHFPFSTSDSSLIAINLTYTWGEPMNPMPMDKSPKTLIKFISVSPPAPHGFNSPGSISFSPLMIDSLPEIVKNATTGNSNNPTNINDPWKKSDHATAKNPPEKI